MMFVALGVYTLNEGFRLFGESDEELSYLMTNPNLFEALPDKFELVVLPDDDPELRAYNLDLLDRYGSEGRSVVFARLSVMRSEATPQVFAPVLKAV